jgi:hypothetical protein
MQVANYVLTAVLVVGVSACRTAPIPDFAAIPVPARLSLQQVELAIVAGILNKPPPPGYDPTQPMSDEVFQRFLWEHFLRDARGRSWFPDSVAPRVVNTSVNTRGYSLRVALEFNQTTIETQIISSENLSQSETRIHRRALQWIARLHDHIRRELGRLSLASGGAA